MGDRLTMHKGYRNANGKAYNSKHMQREGFEKEKSSKDNVYWNFVGKSDKSFSENEVGFYRKHFQPYIDRKNKKAIERRQYGRTETLAGYKEKHPPEETLLYLGTRDVDVDALKDVFEEFDQWQCNRFWKREKGGIQMLNAALHLDEDTPHIHFRQVYLYRDKNGDWQVSQNKALELLGIQPPYPDKPIGQRNNAKMTYTAMCREKLMELAMEHGIELVTEPLPKDEVGLPFKEYIERQKAREAAAAEQQAARETIQALQDDVAELQMEKESFWLETELLSDELQELQEDKDAASEELEHLRRTTGREREAREQKRKAAEEQGYRDGYAAGVRDGVASPTAELLRRREREKEDEDVEKDDESCDGLSRY